MFEYPQINPVMFGIGPIKVHWYGMMYLFGFVGAWLLGIWRARKLPDWSRDDVSDMILYGAIGAVLGGRIGYILFYKLAWYLENPVGVLRIWEGGMSFHGGLLGVLIAVWWFARKSDRHFFQVTDFGAPFVPIGLFFGRIGNFINQELWGRVTDSSWGMVFPLAGPEPRHASQLYEAVLEGVVLFVVLMIYSRKPRHLGSVSGMFLVLYAVFRFIVEFAREPDAHLGFIALDWMTMGQLLSVPMLIAGLAILWWSGRQGPDDQGKAGNERN